MSAIGTGDVVICVDAKPDRLDPKASLLVEGRHYRVSNAGPRDPDGVPCLCFRCLPYPGRPGKGYGFSARRFRKLNDGDDNAELIARIKSCRPVPQKERTNA